MTRVSIKRKKKNRRRRSRFPWAFLLTVILIIGGYVLLTHLDCFSIASVTVEGTETLKVSEITEKSGIYTGENIFSFNTSSAEKRIKEIMMVKSVSITRQLPDSVKITVVERSPFLIFITPDGCVCTDDDGVVINISSSPDRSEAIVVSGIDPGQLGIGEVFDYASSAAATTVKSVTEYLRSSGNYSLISEIYVSERGCYYLYTKKSNAVKFYSFSSFESNEEFIDLFLNCEERPIMVEVIEDSEPVYRNIDII